MPYIPQEARDVLADNLREIKSAGELNYLFSYIITDYVATHGLSYSSINDVLGALEGAKLEFYRRVAVPYEQKKCELNGDVY